MGANDPRGGAIFDPLAWLAGFIKRTKYESSGPCGFGEEDLILCFSHDAPRGGARMDPRDTVGRIYKEDHYTLLHTKYESSGPCGYIEEDFSQTMEAICCHGNPSSDPTLPKT